MHFTFRWTDAMAIVMVFLFAVSVVPAGEVKSPLTTVSIERIVVVTPDTPNGIETWAAEDLVGYLKKMSSRTVPVVKESAFKPAVETYPIYVGKTEPGKKVLSSAGHLGPDEFIMQPTADGLIIVGNDRPYDEKNKIFLEASTPIPGVGTRSNLGACRGVWYLLQKFGGVRWYWMGDLGEVVPERTDLPVPTKTLREQPDFEIRSLRPPMGEYNTEEFTRWYYRTGFGMPGRLIVANHTMPKIAQWIQSEKKPQEWLAMRDGKRDTNLRLLCHHAPGLPEGIIDRLMSYFKKIGATPPILSVMPDDGYSARNICECDLCKADREEGLKRLKREEDDDVPFHNRANTSHYVWPLVLKVAERAKKDHPEAFVTCCAYASYGMPPKTPAVFPDNIGVDFCKERLMYMDKTRKQADRERLTAWAKKTRIISLWEYYCYHMWGNPIPLHCPRNIAEDIQFLKGKILGERIEIESLFQYNMNHSGLMAMDGLNVYVTGQFWLDADQDINEVLNEFYTKFFGPAEPVMREFFEGLETAWSQNVEKGRQSDKYDLAFAEQCMARLKKARAMVPTDSVYAQRIDLLMSDFTPWLTLLRRKADPPSYRVRLTEAPSIDAKLADATWANTPAITYTFDAGYTERGGFPDYQNCTTKITRDREKIYLAARIGTDYDTPLAVERFGNPYDYEYYKAIFVSPDGKRYVLTVRGRKLSKEVYPKPDSAWNVSWKADVQFAQHRERGQWLIEMAVPRIALGMTPGQDGAWTFNSHILSTYMDPLRPMFHPHLRNKRGKSNYYVSWQPEAKTATRGDPPSYIPTYYGTLILSD